MPAFEEAVVCGAAAEEVWKLLYDPSRFPEWWAGLARVEASGDGVARYMADWPDFAYPTEVATSRDERRVTVSCLLSSIRHDWTLSPVPGGCLVRVRVDVPDAEAARLDRIHTEVRASLPRLSAAAERAARSTP